MGFDLISKYFFKFESIFLRRDFIFILKYFFKFGILFSFWIIFSSLEFFDGLKIFFQLEIYTIIKKLYNFLIGLINL